MNSTETVSAIQYEVNIYESVMDSVRGRSQIANEIFIPSMKLIVNSKGGFFYAEKPRNIITLDDYDVHQFEMKTKEIQLPIELVEKIVLIANLKLELSAKEKKVASDLQNFWG